VQLFAEDYDFDSFCGTEIGVYGKRLTGEVTRRFNGHAEEMGGEFADSIAVRDSGSDHQVFALAGTSIALNAKASTRRLASTAVDIDDLMKLLPLMRLR
jgi:phosphoserine phosphatase